MFSTDDALILLKQVQFILQSRSIQNHDGLLFDVGVKHPILEVPLIQNPTEKNMILAPKKFSWVT